MRNQSGRGRVISIVTEGERHGARHIINAISNQVALMESKGYSKRQQDEYVFRVLSNLERGNMNEGVLSSLGNLLSWASNKKYLQPIQNWMGKKLAGILGLKEGTMIYGIVVNFVENMQVAKIQQMFSGGGACRPLVSQLAGAVQETIVEQSIKGLGLEPTSALGKAIQEGLQSSFAENGPFVRGVTNAVCSLNISDFFGGGKADVKAAIAGSTPGAETQSAAPAAATAAPTTAPAKPAKPAT